MRLNNLREIHTDAELALHCICCSISICIALAFVAAKAYVAPLKNCSIPYLEFMSAVVLTRLVALIKSVINVTKVFLWTDSATVLHWLSLPASNFKPFLSTRNQIIKETLRENADCFQYVNSRSNPADALTKPILASKLSIWHKGPRFILNSSEKWPSFELGMCLKESYSDSPSIHDITRPSPSIYDVKI